MDHIPLNIIVYLKSFVEFAGYIVIGQGLTYILCFGKHQNNKVYKIFQFLTKPLFKVTNIILPKTVNKKHIPYYTLVFLFCSWVILIAGKVVITIF